jgi:integrase
MPLRVTRRDGSSLLWITGTVRGRRIRESAGTDDPRLAEELRATREAALYRAAVHGTRPVVTVATAAESYLVNAGPHSAATMARIGRLMVALGPRAVLAEIDQRRIDTLAAAILRPTSGQTTRLREITTPIRAILTHAARRGWCDMPALEAPPPAPPRTEWLTPTEADALEAAATAHLRPLVVFLISTGARLGEALRLEWPDVDLAHARARLRLTKSGRDRQCDLCPRAVAALEALPHRIGAVFRTRAGHRYEPKRVQGGGQIKTAWATALRRAGLATPGRTLSPHTLRHTWATWHATIHRDPQLLRYEGGWASLTLVDRYAHLAPRTMAKEMAGWRGNSWHISTPPTSAVSEAC